MIRKGVRASEFAQTPGLLAQKVHKKVNILVGDDPVQVRFVEQTLGISVEKVGRLEDKDVLSVDSSKLFQVISSRHLEFSPNTLAKVGIWSLDPLVNGSDGVTAIVKYAVAIVGLEKPSKEQLTEIARRISSREIEDVRAAVWDAVWHLTGDAPKAWKPWLDPWTDPKGWLPSDLNPEKRLNSLYWDLVLFCFTRRDEEEALKKAANKSRVRVSPSKYKYFKGLNLDLNKVYDSFYLLSRWRAERFDAYVCALLMKNIWATQ
jgi:hypothetical protein